jgi:hypothetical protein
MVSVGTNAELTKGKSGEQVGEISGAILDGDDLADLEASLPEVAHHDLMFGLALDGDHELAATGQVTGLGVVVQRHRHEPAGVDRLEEAEHLQQGGLGPFVETRRRSPPRHHGPS